GGFFFGGFPFGNEVAGGFATPGGAVIRPDPCSASYQLTHDNGRYRIRRQPFRKQHDVHRERFRALLHLLCCHVNGRGNVCADITFRKRRLSGWIGNENQNLRSPAPRRSKVSAIVNRQSSIVNRQSSIVNRQSSI